MFGAEASTILSRRLGIKYVFTCFDTSEYIVMPRLQDYAWHSEFNIAFGLWFLGLFEHGSGRSWGPREINAL